MSEANVTYPITQNNSPYFDNGVKEINNGYVTVLFQPERALQSRELITLQSLLQFQVGALGSFDFQNGSPVSGGQLIFDNSPTAVVLQANDNITLSDFDGQLLINPTGGVTTTAVCIAVDNTISSNTVDGALILKYLSSQEFNDGDSIQISSKPAEIAQALASNATQSAAVVTINEGVFFIDGYFVHVDQQTIVVSSSTAFPNAIVGLEISQNIINYVSDPTLLDPALGSSNYGAPGADRLQLQLTLAYRPLNTTDLSQFIPLMTIINGVVTNQVTGPQLGGIEQSIAENIRNINGNFVVNPFLATTADDPANANAFVITVSPGLGYVNGFELRTISPTQLSDRKALDTATSNSYYMGLDFGNYVTVSNVNSGNSVGFNTGNFGSLDLHLVPSGNVNTTNAQAYANTMIGTAWIRDIEYNGVNSWLAYLLNANLNPIVVNAHATSANTTMVYLPPTFTKSANAIANVPLTVLAGNSSGDQRIIVSYDASSQIGYLNTPTTQLLDTNSKISLGFAIKDINGLVATPAVFTGNAFATQNDSAGLYPCMDIATFGGKDGAGNTVLYSPQLNKLDYSLGQSFITQGDFSDVTFQTRLTLTNVSFTSGNTTVGSGSGMDTNQQYIFGYTDQYLPDSIAQGNFFVVVRNSQTSNLANGAVLTWDYGSNPAGNGIYQTDDQHCTIKTITTGNFLADILVTVQDNDASVNFRRTKTLIGNTSNTSLRSTDSYLNGTAVIGVSNTYIDTTNGYVWFTNTVDAFANVGSAQSLYLPDVIQIIKVFDSGDINHTPNVSNAIDVTNRFGFNSGQTDNYYDHGSLILLPGNQPPTGQTVVMLQAYTHDTTAGFFSSDSYSASNYANNQIPVYSSQQFGSVNLRDVIDFRPTRTIGTSANVQSFNLTGLELPQPSSTWVGSYDYYLPRSDVLVLTQNKQFAIIQGVPALNPSPPAVPSTAMLLYNILVSPYTYVAANVNLSYVENRRYTMSDIGNLDNRISHLEYYASLSQLEQQATKQTVLYQDGTAKESYGIVTDAFIDYSVADTTNPDLLCQIGNGKCGPYQSTTPVGFNYSSNTGPMSNNERTYTLAYTETPVIVQNTASDYEQIQPYAFGKFQGQVKLYPGSDYWYSDELMPQIVGPPQDIPPVVVTPAAPKPSTVGIPQNTVTPPTVTTVAPPPTPPPAIQGAYYQYVNGQNVYAIPISGWDAIYGSLFNWSAGYRWYPQNLAVIIWNGQPYMLVKATATGWAFLSPEGGWYTALGSNQNAINSLQKLAYNANTGNSLVATSQLQIDQSLGYYG